MIDTAPPAKPRLLGVILFTLAYMGAAMAVSARQGNGEFLFYIVVMLVLIAVVAWVHRRIQLTTGLIWALAVWGFLHMAGGLVPLPKGWPYEGEHAVLYSWWIIPPHWLKYDQVVHAFGFGVTTMLCWHGMKAAIAGFGVARQSIRPTLGLLVLSAAAGMGFGGLNEVIEFIAVLTIPNTNVGGYENTGWDLVSNLVGCCGAALLIRLRSKR
ncbi:MAG: DUF2238 domain-containing protein [Verrucomicrobiales bacterium]|nr:DUF2238 domain-containing protein [Verrucomicrobiales bacterium]